jgi:hypothetical protein
MALRSSSSGSSFSAPKIELGGANTKKLVIAGVLLAVAGVLLADAAGIITIFGSKPEPMVMTAEQEAALQAARERDAQLAEQLRKNPNVQLLDGSEPNKPK